jgi:hypothetical protein
LRFGHPHLPFLGHNIRAAGGDKAKLARKFGQEGGDRLGGRSVAKTARQ